MVICELLSPKYLTAYQLDFVDLGFVRKENFPV